MVHAFRGELDGEPRSRSEDGLSERARSLSTWRSRLSQNMFTVSGVLTLQNITHFKDFCLSSVTSRSARRFSSCSSLSDVC